MIKKTSHKVLLLLLIFIAIQLLLFGITFFKLNNQKNDGLVINPAITSSWSGYKMRRQYQGAIYNINVTNPDGVECGVKSVIVDGKQVDGNKVPSFKDGKEHTVEVVLG